MPQKKTPGRKARSSPYLFIALSAILLLVMALFGIRALNTWNLYTAEAAVTPTPSPTVRPVSVTPNPYLVTNTPAPTATPSYMASGSQGEMVSALQERLRELGYYSGAIDGQYGSGTKRAVEIFQRQHGLDADGIAGSKTLGVLYSENARQIEITPVPTAVNTLAGDQPMLVNKWHPVPDGFEPDDLVTVKDLAGNIMTYASDKTQGVREAVEALIRLIRAAQEDGITPWKLREGYRTVKDQQRIFDNRVNSYISKGKTRSQALSRTRAEVADPGASEHHTGLAFDLNVPGESFVDTAQYVWLNKHCWEYGFIMRYTDEKEDITGITGEEWHIRYVGEKHSQKMKELGYCLEEYIDYLNGQ